MPKVLYTTGNLERDIFKMGEREYYSHAFSKITRTSLINVGFDADTISPDFRDIPAGISCLILADPKTRMSPLKEERIKKYLDQGGNAFILGEPGKQEMLNPLLSHLGTALDNGSLVYVSKHEVPNVLPTYFTSDLYFMSDAQGMPKLRARLNNPKYKDTVREVMHGAAAVQATSETAYTYRPLLLTREGTFNKAGRLVVDSTAPGFNPAEGDVKKTPFTVMARLTRDLANKQQRIIIAGDADCLSRLRGGVKPINISFFSWLDTNRFPVYTPMPDPTDQLFTISGKAAKTQSFFFIWILPALLLLLGIVILVRRKRK
jgi:ABC-2 type transport system permease protein